MTKYEILSKYRKAYEFSNPNLILEFVSRTYKRGRHIYKFKYLENGIDRFKYSHECLFKIIITEEQIKEINETTIDNRLENITHLLKASGRCFEYFSSLKPIVRLDANELHYVR